MSKRLSSAAASLLIWLCASGKSDLDSGCKAHGSLRTSLDKLDRRIKLHYPPVKLCTDNAAMIAWTAILRLQDGAKGEGFGLPIRAKWSLEDLYDDL